MKHDFATIEQAYKDFMEGKIDAIGIHNEIVLAKEELQQQNTMPFIKTINSVRIINHKRYIAIDEILGENQRKVTSGGVM